MQNQLSEYEFGVYLKLLVKALHGARSTLAATCPAWADKMTLLIEMPRATIDEIQMFLLRTHKIVLEGRSSVGRDDPEAASLFDAIHNIPYGLLGRFDGTWDWRQSLPDILKQHESNHLRKLRKYSGLLDNMRTRPNAASQGTLEDSRP